MVIVLYVPFCSHKKPLLGRETSNPVTIIALASSKCAVLGQRGISITGKAK
jgi:hypothetical protein